MADRQSQVQPGTGGYSQVQCWKDPPCAIFWKSRCFEDIKYDTERSHGDHMRTTWGPPGDHLRTSYMACLGIIWGMFGHYLGQSTISAVLHASLMPYFKHCLAFSTDWIQVLCRVVLVDPNSWPQLCWLFNFLESKWSMSVKIIFSFTLNVQMR